MAHDMYLFLVFSISSRLLPPHPQRAGLEPDRTSFINPYKGNQPALKDPAQSKRTLKGALDRELGRMSETTDLLRMLTHLHGVGIS